ncbi:MAG: hemerythrin domain-containing protein [Elusimicrobia bacterium]|nr:hemerythrin domain-containing protein [Elusimicrobiota bacterium]
MERIYRLFDEHKDIRRLMANIRALLDETCGCAKGEFLDRASADKLTLLVNGLSSKLSRHEAFEDALLTEACERAAPESRVAVASVRSDHESIHRIFELLKCLRRFDHEDTGYSIRFAVSNLLYTLDRHLAYEEKVAFPILRGWANRRVLQAAGR